MKRCSICKVEKELIDFKKDKRQSNGCSSSCKECARMKGLLYYHENKNRFDLTEKRKIRQKNYRENNKEILSQKFKKWCSENQEKMKSHKRNYRNTNKQKINEYQRQYTKSRFESDPLFKLSHYIRSIIYKSLKKEGFSKKSKTFEILCCDFDFFKKHLESKFESWMNWENYGLYNGEDNYGWDLDHIIPLSSAKSEEEVIQLNHYTNLQPLCSKVNRFIKKDNF